MRQRPGESSPGEQEPLKAVSASFLAPAQGKSHLMEAFYEHSLDPIVTISPEGRITDVNKAAETITGVPLAELAGTDFSDYFLEKEFAITGFQLVLRAGFVRDYPLTVRHVSGRKTEVLCNAVLYRNNAGDVLGVFAAARDVTAHNRAETELARYRDHLEDLIRARTAELETANTRLEADITERKKRESELRQLNRTLKALSASSQAMMRADDEASYLGEVCQIIARDCGHPMVWIGFARNDPDKTVLRVAHAGADEGFLESLRVTWADDEFGRGPTGTSIRTGRPITCKDLQTDPCFAPWRREALHRGFRSAQVVPLLDHGKAFGCIAIYSRETDAFNPEEVNLLSELAGDVGYGVSALRLRKAHAQAEQAFRDQEQELAAIYENAPLIILLVDGERRVRKANKEAAMFSGGNVTDLIGCTAGEALRCLRAHENPRGCGYGPHCAHCLLRATILDTVLTGGGRQQVEVTLSVASLSGAADRTFLVSTLRLNLRGIPMALVTMQDITPRKRAEEELKAAHSELEARVSERTDQLRALAAELTQSEGRERRRIAQILHDNLQQLLVAARLRIEALRDRKASRAIAGELAKIEDLVGESSDVARGLSHELSPAVLHEHGLVAGLRWLGRWMHDKHRLVVRVSAKGGAEKLDHDVKVLLFQSVRELLFNVIKHAGVKHASIRLRLRMDGRLEILVSDRGRGIDAAKVRDGRIASAGFGLFGIRERLAFVGGSMDVESNPGGGARFRLLAPLPDGSSPGPSAAMRPACRCQTRAQHSSRRPKRTAALRH